MASLTSVRAELKTAGTAQNQKIYARHGVTAPMHGVPFGAMRKLAKRLSPDHKLAQKLLASGNHDEAILALMIGDSAQMSKRELDAFVSTIDNYPLSDQFASFVGAGPHRDSRADKWTKSSKEFVAHTGWNLVSQQVNDATVSTAYLKGRLEQIEAGIDAAPNRAKHAMHMTLISIGGHSAGLRRSAVAATKRIGIPVVDHGQTNCTTPEAIGYIDRIWEHRAQMEAKAAAKAAAKKQAKK